MGTKFEILGKKYKAKKLKKKDIEKMLETQRANDRKEHKKDLKERLSKEKRNADKRIARILTGMAEALGPTERIPSDKKTTPS